MIVLFFLLNIMKIEIACFNLTSALIAQEANADRIELCDALEVGGITPDKNTIIKAGW